MTRRVLWEAELEGKVYELVVRDAEEVSFCVFCGAEPAQEFEGLIMCVNCVDEAKESSKVFQKMLWEMAGDWLDRQEEEVTVRGKSVEEVKEAVTSTDRHLHDGFVRNGQIWEGPHFQAMAVYLGGRRGDALEWVAHFLLLATPCVLRHLHVMPLENRGGQARIDGIADANVIYTRAELEARLEGEQWRLRDDLVCDVVSIIEEERC